MAESEEKLKSLLMKVESEKAGIKLNIQKAKIMASSPINSLQIDGETMETVTDFVFLGSKITADGDCSHEMAGYRGICQATVHGVTRVRHDLATNLPPPPKGTCPVLGGLFSRHWRPSHHQHSN